MEATWRGALPRGADAVSGLDWIEVYAEARVAFAADVWLRTEDAKRGGIRITAYRREFDPPLPEGFDPGDACEVLSYLPPSAGDPTGLPTVLHREVIHHLSYVVRHDSPVGLVTSHAAFQWRTREAFRRVAAFGARLARPAP